MKNQIVSIVVKREVRASKYNGYTSNTCIFVSRVREDGKHVTASYETDPVTGGGKISKDSVIRAKRAQNLIALAAQENFEK